MDLRHLIGVRGEPLAALGVLPAVRGFGGLRSEVPPPFANDLSTDLESLNFGEGEQVLGRKGLSADR